MRTVDDDPITLISIEIAKRVRRDMIVSPHSFDVFNRFKPNSSSIPPLIPIIAPPFIICKSPAPSEAPSPCDVYGFLTSLIISKELGSECGIIALMYMDRVRLLISLKAASLKIVTLVCVMLAAKIWEDDPRHWPWEFSQVSEMSASKICAAEKLFCKLIDFDLHVDGERYRSYHDSIFKKYNSKSYRT